jgi:hypothetical protein
LFDRFDDLDPFDLWTKRFPRLRGFDFDSDLDGHSLDALPPVPSEYQIDRPADPVAFLTARIEPSGAVVGEQVTLRIVAHGSRGLFREGYTSEPKRPDFLSHSIVDNSYGERAVRQMADDVLWHSVKVRELALFPLKAGLLTIGSMTMDFEGPRYSSRQNPKGTRRRSQALTVHVTEPPIAGRPPGYQIGDVGQFRLDATVEPRQTPAGGAVSVVATLRGTGYLPASLRLPEQHGVEWLKPTTSEQAKVHRGRVGGTRRLAYIVELQRAGTVDLGELRLPFYDPVTRRYEVARARLGSVVVTPSAGAAKPDAHRASDPLLALMQPRHQLGPPASAANRLSERAPYWLLLVLGPLGIVLTASLVRVGRSISARVRSRRQNPKRRVLRLLREARDLEKSGQIEQAVARVEKAILSAVDSATGLKARGVLRAELGRELGARGVEPSLGSQVAELLEQCESMRFTNSQQQPTASLVRRAEEIAHGLLRTRRIGDEDRT